MKILSNNSLLVAILVIQAVFAFHELNAQLPLDIPSAEIVASASTSDHKIMALLTKAKEVRVY